LWIRGLSRKHDCLKNAGGDFVAKFARMHDTLALCVSACCRRWVV
jgi:hypothetical protein